MRSMECEINENEKWKKISVIHFSSRSQNGRCDCGFGQHMLRYAVHCGSATIAAFTIVILCWILLQWAVSRIACSVYYCQWHWECTIFIYLTSHNIFLTQKRKFWGRQKYRGRPVTLSGTKETGSCYCIRYQCKWTT